MRAEESYPAQMQRILDAAAPGVYSIVNRGVPGFNSAQVRRRLPNWIAELQPDTVVVLVGTNNVWNLTDEDTGDGWHGQLYASILRLRTVRFVRVWLHQRSLDANLDWRQIPFGDRPRFSPLARNMAIDWGGDSEVVDVQSRPAHLDESAVQRARRDYEAIVRIARERRVGVVLITYGGPNALFQPFSDAMREVAMHERCPLVDAAAAVRRVPRNKVSWTFGMHPGPALLTEIARDVAAVVRAAGDGSAAGSPPAK